MLFQVEGYPDWIEEMYSEASLYNKNIKEDIDDEVWRQAREKEQAPHIGNIVFDVLANAIIRAIIEEDKLDEDKVLDIVQIYPDDIGSFLAVDGKDMTEFEQLKEAILKVAKD